MSDNFKKLEQDSMNWLKAKVFPLWLRVGIDPETGIFVENLSYDGKPQNSPRRALVQARQLYAFAEGARLKILNEAPIAQILEVSARAFIKSYALPSGAFVHSMENGKHSNLDVDLYSQAFAIFGLAQAYEFSRKEEFKATALKIVSYLNKERKNKNGGFVEIKNGQTFYQSNPHMHLFEAALAWLKIDHDPSWYKLSQELYQLCVTKFIDPESGLLAEHFNESWQALRENGKFIFEPGHHYEWSWLLLKFQNENLYSKKLFELAEHFGLSANKELAFDEVWSDGLVKKKSSRFWPQSERIKSAVVLGQADIADIALKSLIKNFLIMEEGLWKDTLLETGGYGDQPVKASSFYHIINAISEYVKCRPGIGA